MRGHFGETRSSIHRNHALISSDSHERTTLPGWPGCEVTFVITPQMGARFSEFFADLPQGAAVGPALPGIQRFLFVLAGEIELAIDGAPHTLGEEAYALLPADSWHEIRAVKASRLVVLEKRYAGLAGTEPPQAVIARAANIPGSPIEDGALVLQKLIPEDAAFDCEVNLMDFVPGGSLPYVETHFMEHGLLFLNGGGIYRLGASWYPVEQGDVIWMGPFEPQWFGAIGKTNARYLIYKNWNRDPHCG
ncbi:(S)-ureidoglycine aminohydrolase [Aquamicrobium soli]|jgi:(S)-ureidoglycine aminohydrolase|uniref:(S)-ureidoglycine aminohydrolase n=1 Tax=Aquamicrobium soli TaxID=1811518 RepID=A0ABV7KAZ7_9HYPH